MADKFLIPPAPPRPFIGRVAEMEQLEREVYSGRWLCQGRIENSEWVLPGLYRQNNSWQKFRSDTPATNFRAAWLPILDS
jgi:hypothetical protein